MSEQLFRIINIPSDEPVQFVGVHPLKWHRRPLQPDVGFTPVENYLTTQLESCERKCHALEQRLKLEDGIALLETVRGLSYDSGWLAAKIEMGLSQTPESDNLDLGTLIERRNNAFRKLAAALIED